MTYRLLEDVPGARRLLLANEAIARGALEAGVAYVAAYPGTPSTEISEALARAAREDGRLYFEYSTNEKVALEIAAGAAWGGRRALTAMKQVGLNVAADPLLTLGAVGVIGGLVIVTADDPSQHSSQTEQDNRHYARLADLPMLEPASADEARRMTAAAFDLSEELGFPVLLRTTTRLAHLRGVVTLGPLRPVRPPPETVTRDPRRFVNLPANAPANRARHLQALARAAAQADRCEWNVVRGAGDLGIVASGIARAYVRDALRDLGLEDRVALFEVGLSWPFPRGRLAEFLAGKRRVLVVEELEPLVEQEVLRAAHVHGGPLEVLGKASGHFGVAFEYQPDRVAAVIRELVDGPRSPASPAAAAAQSPPPPSPLVAALPRRPPVLCAGCAHRASFYAAAVATGGRGIFENDIGCYTLGYGPPFDQAQHLICMGGAINLAAALSRQTTEPVFAYVGDSTFFHSGITGLINAVHNGYKFVVVVLDNLTTAMTGHQPHPGTASREGRTYEPVEIEALARASGAKLVEVVNPMRVEETVAAMRRAIATDGMAVVISRAPCALLREAEPWHEPRSYRVVESACCTCGCTVDGQPCAVPLEAAEKRFRSERRILSGHGDAAARVRPEIPALAPCSAACPAGVCAQGYVNHLAAGRPIEALRLIRERVALPGTLGHVCHHPCESACERGRTEAPLAIREMKRFAASFDDPPETHWLREKVARAADTGRRVAVVGSGPAGLQCAAELRLRGHRVTVFERSAAAGGLLATAIPPFRLPRNVLRQELAILEALGIEIRCNTPVVRDPRADGFDAAFLAVGAGRTRRLGIPDEDGPGVVDALELLEAFALEHPFRPGERVVVSGGGNAAVDAARAAVRLGAREVTIVYRRGEAEMPALREEVEAARAEGVRVEFLAAPVEVRRVAGRLAAVLVQPMRLAEPDGSGRPRPVPVEGTSPREIPCDLLVRAIGQAQDETVARTFGVAVDEWGRIRVDPETLATSVPGIFAGGDAVHGPWTVVDALASGKRAAWGIDRFLRGAAAPPLDLPRGRPAAPPVPRTRAPAPPLGRTPEAAQREASRCLACGACAHCRVCVDLFSCPAIAVVDGRVTIDPIACNGCGVCAQICPNGAIERIERPAADAATVPAATGPRPAAATAPLPVARRAAPPRRPGAPLRIVLAGVGGQGSLRASRTLGQAALDAGLEVVMSELHGMSQRGGVVVSTVILGGAHGPIVADGDADVLVAFEPLEAVRALRFCSERTLAVVNLRGVPPPSVALGGPPYPTAEAVRQALETACGRVVATDAAEIAERSGAPRAANAVVLGMLAATGILPFPVARLEEAIRASLPSTADPVLAAFAAGRTVVS